MCKCTANPVYPTDDFFEEIWRLTIERLSSWATKFSHGESARGWTEGQERHFISILHSSMTVTYEAGWAISCDFEGWSLRSCRQVIKNPWKLIDSEVLGNDNRSRSYLPTFVAVASGVRTEQGSALCGLEAVFGR